MALAWTVPAIWGALWVANGLFPATGLGKALWNWVLPALLSTLAGGMIAFVGVIAVLLSKRDP